MLRAAVLFFAIGLLAVVFGAYGVAGVSIEAGRLLLFVFLALSIASAIFSWIGRGGGRHPPV